MRRCPDTIEAGGVYLLDDLTHAQVTAVTADRIRYRARTGASCLRRWRAHRGVPVAHFRQRVRAEVDVAFFPEFADAGAAGTTHSAAEQAGLEAALRSMGGRRPFGIVERGPP